MNQRIRELALQADLMRYPSDGINIRIEKFAEMIVRECMEICESGTATQTTSAGAAQQIRQHFGVKE